MAIDDCRLPIGPERSEGLPIERRPVGDTGVREEGRDSGLRTGGSGFAGRDHLRGQSVDSTVVASQVVQPKKPRRTELRGLTNHVFSERWTTLSGLAGRRKRGDADLLI